MWRLAAISLSNDGSRFGGVQYSEIRASVINLA